MKAQVVAAQLAFVIAFLSFQVWGFWHVPSDLTQMDTPDMYAAAENDGSCWTPLEDEGRVSDMEWSLSWATAMYAHRVFVRYDAMTAACQQRWGVQ